MAPTRYHSGRFPPQRIEWPELIPLIGPASAAIARYDGALAAVPNPDILRAPLTTQEAVLSSRIEGTQASMSEVLGFEAGQEPQSPTRRDDIQEVLNYRSALRHSEDLLRELPLSQRVIREAHRVLLSGVRGEGQSPGDYRRIPNWIGPPGCSIEDATFIPVGAERLQDAISDWERYLHRDEPDQLVQLAILHAEFEALHPFLDGNGRLGRMLVPLFLWQRDLIREPMFYISAYFEAHREAYYNGLLAVSRDDDWTGWCRFFLTAVRVQAEDNLRKAERIIDLYSDLKPRITDLTRSRYAINALDWIFRYPIFSSAHFATRAGIPPKTARRFLRALCDGEILQTIIVRRGRRAAVLAFPAVLRVAEGRDVI